MAARSRFSTSSVIDSEYLVPCSPPTKPSARDYFFRYSWILSGIFNPQVNLHEHRYFGSSLKDSAPFLFDFWANSRRGDGLALQRYRQFGFFSDNELSTPMAAYHHGRSYRDIPGSLLIQHGSYQWVSLDDQPSIHAGEVSLYRGIGRAARFRYLRFQPEELSPANGELWRMYLRVQQTCCRTRSCLSTRFMTASSAARPQACATGVGWAT